MVAVFQGAFGEQHADRLARKVDARGAAEAEFFEIVVKGLLPEREDDIYKTGVAAVVERPREREVCMLAVLVIAPAADRRALYIAGAAARKDGFRRIGALVPAKVFFDICSRRDDLEGGARLVGVAYERVAGERVELRGISARDVVEVVRWKVDHRKHGKIGRVEHDAPRRLRPVLLEGARHHLFRQRLDARVEGERHVEPVLCGEIGSARTFDLHTDKVGLV